MRQLLELRYPKELAILGRLFRPEFSGVTLARLNDIFERTEAIWQQYANRIPARRVNYLLVAEAPPWSECGQPQYVLDPLSRPRTLMKALCQAFFGRPAWGSEGTDLTLTDLAARGLLVVDSIPFAMPYGKVRGCQAYSELVSMTAKSYMLAKLEGEGLTGGDNLRIAFAFKRNGLAVMRALGSELILAGRRHSLSSDLIAVGGAGYPDGVALKKVFGLAETQGGVPQSSHRISAGTVPLGATLLPQEQFRSQPVTGPDRRAGRIRIPTATKALFPRVAGAVKVVLRGEAIQASWNPRLDDDRSRSGVLGIGREPLQRLVREGEVLCQERFRSGHFQRYRIGHFGAGMAR